MISPSYPSCSLYILQMTLGIPGSSECTRDCSWWITNIQNLYSILVRKKPLQNEFSCVSSENISYTVACLTFCHHFKGWISQEEHRRTINVHILYKVMSLTCTCVVCIFDQLNFWCRRIRYKNRSLASNCL